MERGSLSVEECDFLQRMVAGDRPAIVSEEMQARLQALGYVRWIHSRLELTGKAREEFGPGRDQTRAA